MRILLDCRMASWSGIGRYTRGLARALARIPDLEIVQLVADSAEEPPVRDAEAVAALSHPFSIAGAAELGRVVRDVAPDVTHCLHFPTPLQVRHPLVVTLHDLSPLLVPGVMPSRARRLMFKVGVKRAMGVADRIVAISQHTERDLRCLVPAARGKIRVVLEAADDFTEGIIGPVPEDIRTIAGDSYLLSMGNTKPHKDLPTLLRAFARIAGDHPDLTLMLVGREEPGYVVSVLGDAPAAARVRFTGPVDDAVLRGLYAGATAFVFPSRYEGFGLPPLEAMGLGAPVICSDAASLPEVVGDAALLFPAGDADELTERLTRLLGDPELRSDLRSRGETRSTGFSWDKTARDTLAVYREVM